MAPQTAAEAAVEASEPPVPADGDGVDEHRGDRSLSDTNGDRPDEAVSNPELDSTGLAMVSEDRQPMLDVWDAPDAAEAGVAHGVVEAARQAHEDGIAERGADLPWPLDDPEDLLDLADIPQASLGSMLERILAETLAEIADGTAFPAGQVVRIAHRVCRPRITIPIATYENESVQVRLQTVATPDGPLVDLEVRRPASPPGLQPRPKDHWTVDYFWIESHLPCAVAMLPRATLRDLAGLPRLDADAFAAHVERTQPVATPYALGLVIPDARLAVLGLRPCRGRRARFTAIAQLDRQTRTVNRWTVTG
jgi:hypothetical protein